VAELVEDSEESTTSEEARRCLLERVDQQMKGISEKGKNTNQAELQYHAMIKDFFEGAFLEFNTCSSKNISSPSHSRLFAALTFIHKILLRFDLALPPAARLPPTSLLRRHGPFVPVLVVYISFRNGHQNNSYFECTILHCVHWLKMQISEQIQVDMNRIYLLKPNEFNSKPIPNSPVFLMDLTEPTDPREDSSDGGCILYLDCYIVEQNNPQTNIYEWSPSLKLHPSTLLISYESQLLSCLGMTDDVSQVATSILSCIPTMPGVSKEITMGIGEGKGGVGRVGEAWVESMSGYWVKVFDVEKPHILQYKLEVVEEVIDGGNNSSFSVDDWRRLFLTTGGVEALVNILFSFDFSEVSNLSFTLRSHIFMFLVRILNKLFFSSSSLTTSPTSFFQTLSLFFDHVTQCHSPEPSSPTHRQSFVTSLFYRLLNLGLLFSVPPDEYSSSSISPHIYSSMESVQSSPSITRISKTEESVLNLPSTPNNSRPPQTVCLTLPLSNTILPLPLSSLSGSTSLSLLPRPKGILLITLEKMKEQDGGMVKSVEDGDISQLVSSPCLASRTTPSSRRAVRQVTSKSTRNVRTHFIYPVANIDVSESFQNQSLVEALETLFKILQSLCHYESELASALFLSPAFPSIVELYLLHASSCRVQKSLCKLLLEIGKMSLLENAKTNVEGKEPALFSFIRSLMDMVDILDSISPEKCEQYFAVLSDLFILVYHPSTPTDLHISKSTPSSLPSFICISDLCIVLSKIILFRPTLERYADSGSVSPFVKGTDIVLTGFLKFLTSLLPLSPSVKDLLGTGKEFNLITHIFHHMLMDVSCHILTYRNNESNTNNTNSVSQDIWDRSVCADSIALISRLPPSQHFLDKPYSVREMGDNIPCYESPQCKRETSRKAAMNLLLELCEGSQKNTLQAVKLFCRLQIRERCFYVLFVILY
jgi:hypothetical protein